MFVSRRVATLAIIAVIIAIIAEDSDARKKKSKCRYRRKKGVDTCVDIMPKRVPKRCRKFSNIKGKCEEINGVCELSGKLRRGKPGCVCNVTGLDF